jgi:hypothetical protein
VFLGELHRPFREETKWDFEPGFNQTNEGVKGYAMWVNDMEGVCIGCGINVQYPEDRCGCIQCYDLRDSLTPPSAMVLPV